MSVCYRKYGTSSSIGKNVLRADVKLTLVEKWSVRGVIAELRLALRVRRLAVIVSAGARPPISDLPMLLSMRRIDISI